MKIVVLGGGISPERHVSLVTSTSVCRALRERGHQAVFVDMFLGLENYSGTVEDAFLEQDGLCGNVRIEKTEPDIAALWTSRKLKTSSHLGDRVLEICQKADCVFLGLHGIDGEDGKIQGTLDLLGVPYTGSNMLSSAIAMDKAMTKRIMAGCNVRTPEWQELTYSKEDIPCLAATLPVPSAVKAVDGGSSLGVELPDTREELERALGNLLHYGKRVVVEKKIKGIELTVPVLNDRYLEPIEIVPPEGTTFDYVAKYQSGEEGAREICPARISDEAKKQVGEAALRLHKALGLSVYSRTDFILDEDGLAWCLEVNTLPGMTPASLIPRAAKVAGMSYGELCDEIVRLSVVARKI